MPDDTRPFLAMVVMSVVGALIDLNGRPQYVHWGRFAISVANLVVIAVMIAVFVLTIAGPYLRRIRKRERSGASTPTVAPVNLLGVLSLAALVVVVTSGVVIAAAGPAWWHRSGTGRFVNSVHLWSAQLFFVFLVVHLWAKFFLSAWPGRGRRAWVTGAVAFLVSIPCAFTGYLSQQNFDAQWIALEAKDGLNASGIGAFFNPLDYGQMLLWHVLVLPLALGVLVWLHLRVLRRAAPGTDAAEGRAETRRFPGRVTAASWLAMLVAAVLLSAAFSSPDEAPVTVARWAAADPNDFLSTAAAELAATSETASAGPPYRNVPGGAETLVGGLSLQRLAGVRIPIDPAHDFVLEPLAIPAATNPRLASALRRYERASPAARAAWVHAYAGALEVARGDALGPTNLAAGPYGPVRTLLDELLGLARNGALDGTLSSGGRFYQSDLTKPLLFLGDGEYLDSLARQQHLVGDQWGMMNEPGNFPGQPWLWLYAYWYQVEPFAGSRNADAQVGAIMAVLSILFVLVPFIPGVRSMPRWAPLHTLIRRG